MSSEIGQQKSKQSLNFLTCLKSSQSSDRTSSICNIVKDEPPFNVGSNFDFLQLSLLYPSQEVNTI